MLNKVHARVRQIRPVLVAAFVVLLFGSILAMFVADLSHKLSGDFRYHLADNLTAVAAVLSFFLAFLLSGEPGEPAEARFAPRVWQIIISAGIGVIVAGAMYLMVYYYYDKVRPYEIVVELATSTAIAAAVYSLLRPAAAGDSYRLERFDPLMMFGAFTLLTVITIVLRWRAAGSDVLTWIVVPPYLFVMPGLSLGLALLPENTHWLERLVLAVPLSITTQLVALVWVVQLGIAVDLTVFFLVSGLINITGFAVVGYQRFMHPGSADVKAG